MNKRKLKRAKGMVTSKATTSVDMIISQKAEQIVQSAVDGDPKIDCIGNFIFFSVQSGEAWLLDHRDNRALRLADNFKALPYKIIETKERFSIQWKERFTIEGTHFIATDKNTSKRYEDYPTKTIEGLIEMLRNK